MDEFSGQSTGRYHIIEKLGAGGMAVVYKAYDTNLECDVAIKFIRMEKLTPEYSDKARARFKIEAQKTAQLLHPNIVTVTDYGEYKSVPFLVMRYIPGGKTLKSLLRSPLPYQEAIKLILPIAQALEVAHEANIIHRDVKPANILLTDKGIPMLSDFGIAKVLEEDDSETRDGLTTTGMAIGTPEYMAPEQWEGKRVDGRADIYSLGVVLYELITGRPPFKADTVPATMVQVLRDPLPRPKQFISNIPERIEQILYKVLAKKPENRYQTMNEFEKVLLSVPTEPRESRSTRKTILLALGGIIILIGIICGLYFLLGKGGISVPAMSQVTSSGTPALKDTSTVSTPQAATETQSLDIGSTKISLKDGMTMMYVPAGAFTMGSGGPNFNGVMDDPPHSVTLDAFWIDQTEVTNEMYQKCVDAGNCSLPNSLRSYTRSSYYGNPSFNNYPVIFVDWDDANTYCEWAGRRLPTEAEWEKAARGTNQLIYPWGNNEVAGNLANFADANTKFSFSDNQINDGYKDTSPVNNYPDGASTYKVLDMAGNVWEWVADWYSVDYYQESPSSNPTGPAKGIYRVLRGGSCGDTADALSTSYRFWRSYDLHDDFVGFRCALFAAQ